MRRLLILPLMLAGLALAGCTTTGGLPTASDPAVQAIISNVQTACNFKPLAETIYAIIAKKDPSASTVSQVVDVICGAIRNAPLAEGRPIAIRLYNSRTGRREVVRIKGSFVR